MYSWLVSEIEEAENSGVEVRVDGIHYSLDNVDKLKQVMENIANALSVNTEVMENNYYMKSYTGDEHGRIVQIDFERIISV